MPGLFSNKPNPEIQTLLREMIPPEVGSVTDEAIEKASSPTSREMIELLSLKTTSVGEALLGGDTGFKGIRYGREVIINFGTTAWGKLTVETYVTTPAVAFEISQKEFNRQIMALPSGMAEVLQQYGPLDKDVTVVGAADGIAVLRKRPPKDAAPPKGTIQWLQDLRLAERLADVFSR
jgi:hypothetical protein